MKTSAEQNQSSEMAQCAEHLPGPPIQPRWLQPLRTIQWVLHPLEVVDARAQRYGDNFRVSPPNIKPALIYFSTPEALEAIFKAKPGQLNGGAGNRLLLPLVGENSISLLAGSSHQRMRQLLMPPFHGEQMLSYGKSIQRITREISQQWKTGTPFRVRSEMQKISLRVILSVIFGLSEGARYEQIQLLLREMLDQLSTPFAALLLFFPSLQQDLGSWTPWGHFLRLRQQVDELIYAEIRERQANPNFSQTDVLSLLLSAKDEAGQPLTEVELRDELISLLFAGHETTASALAWALYWMNYLPEVKTKLLAEISAVDPETDPITIARLPYLTAVCQETLRLYPIALSTFPRIVQQPMQLLGYELEVGTTIIPSIYLAHRRPEVYPNPEQFRPERFLERTFSPYEYLPFGGGDRRCIGAAFALFEMKLVLFTLLSQVDITIVSKTPIKPVRRGFTVAPPNQLQMAITGTH